jgi:hypothetical protein
LPVKILMKYTGKGVYMGVRGERHRIGRLHQHFADRFGWEEMTAAVAKAYDSLSDEDKTRAGILTGNYGEAGAVWLFGEQYDLPKPISGHLQYYLWGPRGCSGEVVLSIGIDIETLKDHFHHVEQRSGHQCLLALRYERYLPVFLCREPKKPLEEMWPNFKHMD